MNSTTALAAAAGHSGSMIDAPTLFVVLIVSNLVLGASLWIGTLRTRRDGIGAWILGLGLQAAGFGLFAVRNDFPGALVVVAANGLITAAVAAAAVAIASFRHRRLPFAAPLAFVAVQVAVSALFAHDPAARGVWGSLVLAAGMALVAVYAWKPTPEVSGATRGLFVGSFVIGILALLGRAASSAFSPELAASSAPTSTLLTLPLLAGFATILASSVSFLLMQTERAEHAANQLASTDPLTGAYNRRTFHDLFGKALSRARRLEKPVSVIMLDLDHFKSVNDTYGHLVGDRVLRRFADVVRSQLRQEDVLVRYGGEEFCVLLPDIDGPGAVTLAGRIRDAVEREPFVVDGQSIRVTTSAGVAARIDEGPEQMDDLVDRADEALYIAKRRGRNRVAAIALGTRVA